MGGGGGGGEGEENACSLIKWNCGNIWFVFGS